MKNVSFFSYILGDFKKRYRSDLIWEIFLSFFYKKLRACFSVSFGSGRCTPEFGIVLILESDQLKYDLVPWSCRNCFQDSGPSTTQQSFSSKSPLDVRLVKLTGQLPDLTCSVLPFILVVATEVSVSCWNGLFDRVGRGSSNTKIVA